MKTAGKVAGAFVLLAGLVLAVLFFRRTQSGSAGMANPSPATGQTSVSSNVASVSNEISNTLSSSTIKNSSGGSSNDVGVYNFGWVAGNDKIGAQTIKLYVHHIDAGTGKLLTDTTSIPLTPGASYDFEYDGALYSTDTGAPLPGWKIDVILFDENNVGKTIATLTTDENGEFDNFFSFKPQAPGIYRLRVAAGDSANEQAIVFDATTALKPDPTFGVIA